MSWTYLVDILMVRVCDGLGRLQRGGGGSVRCHPLTDRSVGASATTPPDDECNKTQSKQYCCVNVSDQSCFFLTLRMPSCLLISLRLYTTVRKLNSYPPLQAPATMLSRKKPSTPVRHNDPKIDEPDTPSPSRRRPVRARYFRRTPLIANLWLRIQRSKGEPLTWLIVFFLATLLLAAGTLFDGRWHVGRVGTEVEMVKNGSNATSSARTPWSFFTFTDINITQGSARSRVDVWPEPSLHPKLRPVSSTAVARDRHGLYIADPLHEKKLSEHPITTLIRAAERKAAEVHTRIHSIQSFEDSVEDYRRAFGMNPPRGFSKW